MVDSGESVPVIAHSHSSSLEIVGYRTFVFTFNANSLESFDRQGMNVGLVMMFLSKPAVIGVGGG